MYVHYTPNITIRILFINLMPKVLLWAYNNILQYSFIESGYSLLLSCIYSARRYNSTTQLECYKYLLKIAEIQKPPGAECR